MIPFQNLRSTHESFIKEYFKDLQQVFAECDFIGAASKRVLAFEVDFANYIGCKYAVSVASGTDALLLPLDALGVKPGDEVIVPAFGFIATADVVVRLGAKPVFVDIDLATFNIDPAAFEAAITPRTKAVIPVHLYGQACNMAAIMEIAEKHNIAVIEDVAQATGVKLGDKRAGAIGTFGAFSFYPTKNLGGAGDGGMVTTNDDNLASIVRRFRDHGKSTDGTFESIGYNSRLDTVQALYLHAKLPDLDDCIFDRIENARLYNHLFEDSEVVVPAVPEDESHTFNLYTIRVRDRNRLQAFLREKEIQSAIYYPTSMHLTPAFAYLGLQKGQFPNSEKAARDVISLPVWPGLKRKEIEKVAETVSSFLANNVALELSR